MKKITQITSSPIFISLLLTGALSAIASADSFSVTYLNAGIQTPTGITTNVESFNTPSTTPYVSTFGGSSITGTYTGALQWLAASQYGGAGGTGYYAEVTSGNSYTLTLSQGVNYFGLWATAMDYGDQLQFYSGSTLVYTFSATQFLNLVASCPSSSPFCGNPNSQFKGGDTNEPFAYLNFFDVNGTFNKIVVSEVGGVGAGFESDNQAVALLASAPAGNAFAPEPATMALFGLSFSACLLFRKRTKA